MKVHPSPIIYHLLFAIFIFGINTPPAVSQEADNGYEELVQINLELRQKLKALEEKHTALENERNVLIVHIRNLQEEKDRLSRSGGGAQEGMPSGDELKAAFGEVSKELGLVAKERDQLKKEFVRLKEAQSKSEAVIKDLEDEKAKLNKEISQIESTFQSSQKESEEAFGSIEIQKASLADQMTRLKETLEKEKAALLAQQEETVEEVKALAMAENQKAAKELEAAKTRAGIEKEEAVETLKNENTVLADQMEGLKKTFEKEKEEMFAQKQMAAGLRQLKKASEYQKKGFLIEKQKAVEAVRIEGQTALKALEKEYKKLTAENKGLEKRQDKLTAAMGQAQEDFRKERLDLEKKLKSAEEKGLRMEKDLAMEVALYRTKEEELKSRYQTLLFEHEDFKREIPRLKEENKDFSEKLKKSDEEKKTAREKFEQLEEIWHGKEFAFKKEESHWRQQRREISGGKEKLEKELQQAQKEMASNERKFQDLKVVLQQTEDKMTALRKQSEAERLAKKEQEALIRKLMGEKSVMEVKLARQPQRRMSSAGSRLPRRGKSITGVDRQRLDMHFNLAVAYDKTGMYREEEQEYLQCLKIDPNDANVHYNLAILYDDRLNDNIKAVKHYEKYLQLRPSGEDTEQVKDWLLYAQEKAKLKAGTK